MTREEAIKIFNGVILQSMCKDQKIPLGTYDELRAAASMAIAALSCKDYVSREAVYDAIIWDEENGVADARQMIEKIRALPGCFHKKGKWLNDKNDMLVCDQCGYMTPYDHAIDDYEYGNYCPNCGAEMEKK